VFYYYVLNSADEILEVLKGKNVWKYVFSVQFFRVRIVIDSWDFKHCVLGDTNTVFHFRNHISNEFNSMP
jgi:hypothetical protein